MYMNALQRFIWHYVQVHTHISTANVFRRWNNPLSNTVFLMMCDLRWDISLITALAVHCVPPHKPDAKTTTILISFSTFHPPCPGVRHKKKIVPHLWKVQDLVETTVRQWPSQHDSSSCIIKKRNRRHSIQWNCKQENWHGQKAPSTVQTKKDNQQHLSVSVKWKQA